MRPCISIRGCVHPSLGRSVCLSPVFFLATLSNSERHWATLETSWPWFTILSSLLKQIVPRFFTIAYLSVLEICFAFGMTNNKKEQNNRCVLVAQARARTHTHAHTHTRTHAHTHTRRRTRARHVQGRHTKFWAPGTRIHCGPPMNVNY